MSDATHTTQHPPRPTNSSPETHHLLQQLHQTLLKLAAEARANKIARSEGPAFRARVRELFQLSEYVDVRGNNLLLVEVPVGLLNQGWQTVKTTLANDAAEISSLQQQINAGGGGTTLTPIQQSAVSLITDQDDVNAANEIVAQAQTTEPPTPPQGT